MEESEESLLNAINHYQSGLERYIQRQDQPKMLHSLGRLFKLPIKVCHLESTGVGRTVNSLRKTEGVVGDLAKSLVAKWKEMVLMEEKKQAETVSTDEDNEIISTHEEEKQSTSHINISNDTKRHSEKYERKSSEKSHDSKSHTENNSKENKHKEISKKNHANNEDDDDPKNSGSEISEHKRKKDKSHENEKNRHKSKESKNKPRQSSDDESEYETHKSRSKHDKHESSDKKEHKHKSSHERREESSKKATSEPREEKRSDKEKKREHKSKESKDKREDRHDKHKSSKHEGGDSKSSDSKKEKDVGTKKKNTKSESYSAVMNGIGSESGTSFADALGMCGPPPSKKKKSSQPERPREPSPKPDENDLSYELPLPKEPLENLDINISTLLPPITPHYRPLGLPVHDDQPKKLLSDDEALSRVMMNKNQRTKVFSGNKVAWGKVPSLFDICVRILQDNLDALEYTGGVPYSILKPILEKATANQLYMMEHHNPYLIEDSDELWKLHCQKEFRNKSREELETWRDMYMRCLDEREAKLKALTANIKQSQDKSIPVRTTKLAYVDSVAKPPRNIARKQKRKRSRRKKKMTFISRLYCSRWASYI
ncbi:hypothetical protein HHI36_016182 [Cryptolaemus montrouzieri]|uniref:TFIIS N-terminal domain-containing protein n=1 Tax=Cryptolaemus montrouzieri TaxID=559131 RepID=A0ABD2NJC2_9CUCU